MTGQGRPLTLVRDARLVLIQSDVRAVVPFAVSEPGFLNEQDQDALFTQILSEERALPCALPRRSHMRVV